MRGTDTRAECAAPRRSLGVADERRLRQDLHAAAERVASELRARRPAYDFNRVERSRLDEIEERVDAAALRAVRVADAVHENVDLVAGEASDEHAGHRGTGLLKLDAGFTLDCLGDRRGDAGGDVF